MTYERKLVIASNYPAKVGGSGDITYLICQVTLQEHVIKGFVTLWKEVPHCM